MRILGITLLTLIVFISVFLLLRPEFKSAFEADQQCHFDMSKAVASNPGIGCDHDIETRQWILFDSRESGQPAEIIKRFKY